MATERKSATTPQTRQQKEMLWLHEVFTQAQSRKYYGELKVVFQGGLVTRIIKEESLMPPRDKSDQHLLEQ